LTLLSHRLVQRGPSITAMIDAWIDRERARQTVRHQEDAA
jgi:hypothetical protein